jgi:hypothetical protein
MEVTRIERIVIGSVAFLTILYMLGQIIRYIVAPVG